MFVIISQYKLTINKKVGANQIFAFDI